MTELKTNTIDVNQVAGLARLKISDEMIQRLQPEMEAIVKYVEMLSDLDVSDVEPTAHAVERVNVIREDCSKRIFTREEMLVNAPATIDGELIKVPQVLPGEGMA